MHHIRIRLIAVLLACVTLLGGLIASAAPQRAVFLPTITTAPAAVDVVLVDHDVGFASAAVTPAGIVLIGYQDRTEHGIVHVARLAGDHLVDVGPSLAAAAAPIVLDGAKQGTLAMVVAGGDLLIVYSSRDDGDATGPFRLRLRRMAAAALGP